MPFLPLPREDTVGRQPSDIQEVGAHQTSDLPAPGSWISQLPDYDYAI